MQMAIETLSVTDTALGGSSAVPRAEELNLPGFEILDVVGRGGMGAVYAARQVSLDRIVAVKILPMALADNPVLAERFVRESKSLARLNHPNIVAAYDAGIVGRVSYLVMEYVAGADLATLIHKSGPANPAEACEWIRQAADALAYTHQKGLVHRDIKPSNLLLDEAGRVRVSDLGLVGVTQPERRLTDSSLTDAGQIHGTVDFMAPEQAANIQQADARSDVYSLGCTLFYLLTGRTPFDGDTMMLRLIAHREQPAPSVRKFRSDVSSKLDAVLQAMMAKRPDDRPQSMDEVQRKLAEVIAGSLGPQVSSSPRRWLDRRLWLGLGLAAAALLLASVAFLSFRPLLRRANSQPTGNVAGVKTSSPSGVVDPGTKLDTTDGLPDAWLKNPLLSADYIWSEPVNLGPNINTSFHEDHVCVSDDELTLIFVRWSRPQVVLQSRRTSRDEPFGPPVPLSSAINNERHPGESPFLTQDGLTLWFTSDRPGGRGKQDLWFSRRASLDAPFEEPANAGPNVNTSDDEAAPFVSPDGLTLLFARGFPRHLYQSTRASTDKPFGTPRRLDSVSVGLFSQFARISSDGLAMVLRGLARTPDEGICLARRRSVDEDFGPPVSLGPMFKDFKGSALALSGDDRTLYFAADRPGSLGLYDLWCSTRIPREPGGSSSTSELPTGVSDEPFALRFDGRDDWVDFRTIPFDSAKPFTIEAQVWLESDAGGSTVMAMSQQGTVKLMAINGGWEVALSDNRSGLIYAFPNSITLHRWQHVALVHEAGKISLYLDGRPAEGGPTGRFGLRKDPGHRAALGTHLGTGVSNALHGKLAEVRISDLARYVDGFVPPLLAARFTSDDHTVALFHFDERDGNRLPDASGHGHNGAILASE
jgi:serine/threonine protein kinase